MCPRCHNPAVQQCTHKKKFALFWIPVIPLKKEKLYHCSICGWRGQIYSVNVNSNVPDEVKKDVITGKTISAPNKPNEPQLVGNEPRAESSLPPPYSKDDGHPYQSTNFGLGSF
ncbi:hypothetical protein AX774_g6463 [Zancudomyces culisetae]|uniref:Zinc-ribbon 15 domain-containing protein n=1 Tax=Zancudomyces culisetae TaxID=1213189 RepID=A0A1R1PGX2_ZANCU|nr:hypothetical protein AX774_g6463 [Zancudomyces culisetae]|eukprot:OMH80102.1 hypothetical protein AX774_g6463 [Zancudomyces culisetae]